MKTAYRILIGIQLSLFVASLCTPEFEKIDLLDSDTKILYGYEVLLGGWWIIMFYHVAWYANLTMLITYVLLLRKKTRWAMYMSIATALITIDAYVYPSDWYVGFYLWIAAMMVLVGVALVAHRMHTKAISG